MVLGSFLLLMSLVLGCLSVFCVDHNLTEDTLDITDAVFGHGNNWEDAKKPAKGTDPNAHGRAVSKVESRSNF